MPPPPGICQRGLGSCSHPPKFSEVLIRLRLSVDNFRSGGGGDKRAINHLHGPWSSLFQTPLARAEPPFTLIKGPTCLFLNLSQFYFWLQDINPTPHCICDFNQSSFHSLILFQPSLSGKLSTTASFSTVHPYLQA